MEPPDVDADLALVLRLADAADEITVSRFGALDLAVDSKPDLTPVTDADRAVERHLRNVLAIERPDDAVHGEEFADTGAGTRRWVIDPIDGTKNFVRGVPVWASLIALTEADEVRAAVVSAPALGRRWWAGIGLGAWTSASGAPATPCRVSGVGALADASLSYSSLSGWDERGLLPGFLDLTRAAWRSRAYGDFWSYVLVAEGAVDLAAEPEVALHDLAAPALIVTEAGGVFTDITGRPGPGGGSALASNGLLHSAALSYLVG